jgi:hypothetical protein
VPALDGFRSVRARSLRWLHALPCALPLLLFTGLAAAEDTEARPVAANELCKTHWTIDIDWLPYCRNQRLGELRETIRRAVIVIHGKQRNAKSYFDAVSRLASEEGHAQDTLVIGLQFLTQADVTANKLPSSVLYWEKEGWKHGMKSLNGAHLSSLEVLDRVLKRLIDQNPNLQQIVIAGHSAGAQFVQKHAAGRRLDTSAWKGQLHYVVTNPGTYMYLSNERPVDTKGCQDTYNDYRYGVENNRLDYFMGTSPDSLWKKMAEYPVTLMLGDEDTDEKEGDQSCPALVQGKNRFERGKQFYRLTAKDLPSHVPGADASRFKLLVIPHVGHEFERMWDSRCGRSILFGNGECTPSRPSTPKAAFPL